MKMKLFILMITAFIAAQSAFAQTEKQIAAIRSEVNLINKNAKNYTKTKRDVEGISLEGTEATYFMSGKNLKKIAAKIYGESFQAIEEIYFSGDEPIFVYRKFSSYAEGIGSGKAPKIVSIKESRFYFSGGKMIRFLNGKASISSKAKFWEDSEAETRSLIKSLKEAL